MARDLFPAREITERDALCGSSASTRIAKPFCKIYSTRLAHD